MKGNDRRRFLARSVAGGSALFLAGCDKLASTPWFSSFLTKAGPFTEAAQTAITPTNALAREFTEADIAPQFRANGSVDPQDDDYLDHVDNGFKDWKLQIKGLVERPYSLSLDELRALPSRTQITRHDCVEGWSCIGKWKGVLLRAVLEHAGVKPQARFVVFRCMDTLGESLYYESCRIVDAFHPQTILAYDLNDKPLLVAHRCAYALSASSATSRRSTCPQSNWSTATPGLEAARAATGRTRVTTGTAAFNAPGLAQCETHGLRYETQSGSARNPRASG
jgi:DMSO/TMAO reductase YedYZ molybdopterin-dependent catalytic subunit